MKKRIASFFTGNQSMLAALSKRVSALITGLSKSARIGSIAAIVAVVAFSTLSQLGGMLADMDPGVLSAEALFDADIDLPAVLHDKYEAWQQKTGGSTDSLAFWQEYVPSTGGPGSLTEWKAWDNKGRVQLIGTWRIWDQAFESAGFIDPGVLLILFFAIDTLLVIPATFLLLGLGYRHLAERIKKWQQLEKKKKTKTASPPSVDDLLGWVWSLALFALFDIVENVAALSTYWLSGSILHAIGVVASISFILKWASLGVAIGALTFAWLATKNAEKTAQAADATLRRSAGVLRTIKGLRVPLALLAVLSLASLGLIPSDIGAQMPDTIRAWTFGQAAVTIGLVSWLAILIWGMARLLRLRITKNIRRGDEVSKPEDGWSPNVRLGTVIVVLAVTQLVFFFRGGFGSGPESFGGGLAIPAAFVVVLALFGIWLKPIPLKDSDGSSWRPETRYEFSERIPRLLAAATLGVTGLALIRAALPHVVFFGETTLRFWWMTGIVLIVLAFVLTVALQKGKLRDRMEAFGAVGWLAVAFVIVPLLALVLEVTGAYDAHLTPSGLLTLGLALLLVALFVYHVLREDRRFVGKRIVAGLLDEKGWRHEARRVIRSILVVTLATAVAVTVSPFGPAEWLGSSGILLIFLIVVAGASNAINRFVEGSEPPRLFSRIGIRRTPVYAMLFVWLMVMASFSGLRAEDFHDVRVADGGLTGVTPGVCADKKTNPDIGDAFERWKCLNPEVAESDGVVPLVIVSAWGGGIRAADWTALVLRDSFEPEGEDSRSPALFVGSGISGGTLGLIEYVAHLTAVADPNAAVADDWVVERLASRDFLAPTLGRLLYVDLPLAFLGYVPVDDRGDILERAWERPWDDESGNRMEQGLLDLWNADVPLVVSNGASFKARCILNASVLDVSMTVERDTSHDGFAASFDDCSSLDPFGGPNLLGPSGETGDEADEGEPDQVFVGMRDLSDFLWEGEDVRLSTAALLSSRFAYISPTGRLFRDEGRCEDDQRCIDRHGNQSPGDDEAEEQIAYILDGGYAELSGALTAFQIWDAVEPLVERHNAAGGSCIVPVMLHIENGFDVLAPQTADPAKPNEWLDPGSVQSERGGVLSRNATQRAAYEFSQDLSDGQETFKVTVGPNGDPLKRYVFVSTRVRLGAEVPLGWTLSKVSHDNMEIQLGFNEFEFATINSWFDDTVSCER